MPLLKQVGALPLRKAPSNMIEVLLVSSRDTGRWVIPKGWPSKRMVDSAAAAREAKQEAGVVGKIAKKPVGNYRYRKIEKENVRLIEVDVYLLWVKKEKKQWKEKAERNRVWFDAETASRKVREPNLRALISALAKR
ncbi:NUDIX hydrolase [Hyphomicrobium denitrificans ATCC 51888]|uniref:NUDIX hydrolase n=1 Tax=Hyphomicrobium denitrificans (strain ATCC 51888 / DSM 1869 / NCIMB 11706 / TK 0415) TaxID=582899 RepID=D8JRY2_HYPDA|nr:NUDIX hydrolase [Hyphomicrobium denitrificans]ADJ24200.1 NUDIX hydrolase [Hyphomicrobium denitrificans ATCC 51888]